MDRSFDQVCMHATHLTGLPSTHMPRLVSSSCKQTRHFSVDIASGGGKSFPFRGFADLSLVEAEFASLIVQ